MKSTSTTSALTRLTVTVVVLLISEPTPSSSWQPQLNGGKLTLKYSPDGSVMSNSGPSPAFLHKLVKRTYIDPSPRYTSKMSLTQADADFLVYEHNKYRRLVPATNMQAVTWDPALAAQAQAHADSCVLQHSTNRVNVGENIWAAPYSDFSGSVKMWFDEVYDRSCGCSNGFKECCGHYTQLVWAETNRVGCGYSYCQNLWYSGGRHYILVCQYSPAGNVLYVNEGGFVQAPAFEYKGSTGSSCSGCGQGYACDNGLCYLRKKK